MTSSSTPSDCAEAAATAAESAPIATTPLAPPAPPAHLDLGRLLADLQGGTPEQSANALATLQRLRDEAETQAVSISPEAMNWLQEQSWPGNIRQLRNLLHAAAVLTTGPQIETDTLRRQSERVAVGNEAISDSPPKTLEEIEHDAILDRLKVFNGNKTLTARDLGVTPRTIRNKLRTDRTNRTA